MRTLIATSVLLLLSGIPARAQFGGMGGMPQKAAARSEGNVQLKLLEIAQEVDETLLREAMLNLGRIAMTPEPDQANVEQVRRQKDVLARFVEKKTEAITHRAAEIAKTRAESAGPVRTSARESRPSSPEKGRSEAVERAKVDVMLLHTEFRLSEQSLRSAVDQLAQAEVMPRDEDSHRKRVETARKTFEKVKAAYVEYGKRLGEEAARLEALDPGAIRDLRDMGMPGMGGMGGGFR